MKAKESKLVSYLHNLCLHFTEPKEAKRCPVPVRFLKSAKRKKLYVDLKCWSDITHAHRQRTWDFFLEKALHVSGESN